MAEFKYLAITNLSYENIDGVNKLFYKNRTINLTFLCDRTWSLSAGNITNFLYKVKIWDNNNNIIYDSTSKQETDNQDGWTSLTNYRYEGDNGLGSFSVFLEAPNQISKIQLEGKGKSWLEKYAFSSIWELGVNGDVIYKELDFYSQVKYSSPLDNSSVFPYPYCSVANPGDIKVVGASFSWNSYTNTKYHNGFLKITIPNITYLGQTVTVSTVMLTDQSGKEWKFDNIQNIQNSTLKVAFDSKLEAPYSIKYTAVGTYSLQLDNSIYPISEFSVTDLSFEEVAAQAYKVKSVGEENENSVYEIEQGSFINGQILINNPKDSPYEFSSGEYYIEAVNNNLISSQRGIYSTTQGKILLQDLWPYGSYIYSSNNGMEQNSVFFTTLDNYYVCLKVKNKFTEQEEIVKGALNNINFLSYPVILKKALSYSINFTNSSLEWNDEGAFNHPLIVNPGEAFKIQVNKEYIYFPSIQKNWKQQEEQNVSYKILYNFVDSISENNKMGYETDQPLIKTYNFFMINNNSVIPFTRDVDIELIVTHNGLDTQKRMQSLRMGRVQPIQVSSCQIKGSTLTYYLKDYGGDKTEENSSAAYIPYDSSLSRSGYEKLILTFKNSENEEIATISIGASELGGVDQARKNFYENIPIRLSLSFLQPDQIAKIATIEGRYNYSYSGNILEQEIDIYFENALENNSNIPTWGLRKNGIIINGKAKQELKPIKNEQGEEIGTYFIEINALNFADRIIVNFPVAQETISGEIYYSSSDNKIHLKGFVVDL